MGSIWLARDIACPLGDAKLRRRVWPELRKSSLSGTRGARELRSGLHRDQRHNYNVFARRVLLLQYLYRHLSRDVFYGDCDGKSHRDDRLTDPNIRRRTGTAMEPDQA